MKKLVFVFLLVCVGCSAQSNPASPSATTSSGTLSPQLQQRIEHQIRAQYELPPDVAISIGAVKPSDIPGFRTVQLILNGHGKEQKLEFLLSNDDKTLARMTKMDLTHDVYAERAGQMDIKGRPVRGNPDAKVTIVNYDDYQCPFCSRMHSTLTQDILPQYADKIKIVYKDYPLPMHPWAKHAANDANCLAKESPAGFWEFADYVHANQKQITGDRDLAKSTAELDRITMDLGKKNGANANALQACVNKQSDTSLKASMDEAEVMGVQATPTMFINGQKLEGAVDAEDVKLVLNEQLKAAGVQPPADTKPAAPAAPPSK